MKYSLYDLTLKSPGMQIRDLIIENYGSIGAFAEKINLYETSINQYLSNKNLGSATFKIRTTNEFGKNFAISWIWKPAIGTLICLVMGYLFSIIIKSDKSVESNYVYTVLGQRESMLKEKYIQTDRIPLRIDKYSILILGLFLFQYLALWAFMK